MTKAFETIFKELFLLFIDLFACVSHPCAG